MASTDNTTHQGDALQRTPTSSPILTASTKPPSTTLRSIASESSPEALSSTDLSSTFGAAQATKSTTKESFVNSIDSNASPTSVVGPTTEAPSESNTTQVAASQSSVSTGSPVSGMGDFGNPVGTLITIVTDPPADADVVVVNPTIFPSTTTVTSRSSNDEPPPAFTDSFHAAQAERPPLSNGATAGIVLAVVAVLLGTFFLTRYIYKRGGLCSKSRTFSPSRESYFRFPPGPTPHPVPPDIRRHSWLSHPASQPGGNYPSVVTTPGQDESIELQSFTRPLHGPRMYDVGHSGNTPIAPHGYPPQDSYAPPISPARPPTAPQATQTVQEEPVSPESPHPPASAPGSEGIETAPTDRRGAVPWEDGYRYQAW